MNRSTVWESLDSIIVDQLVLNTLLIVGTSGSALSVHSNLWPLQSLSPNVCDKNRGLPQNVYAYYTPIYEYILKIYKKSLYLII